MKQRIWDILSVLSLANVLGAAVLLIGLTIGGGLSGEKLALIRDVIAGRPLPAAAGSTTAPDDEEPASSPAGARIARERTETKVRQLQIEQQLHELRDFQAQLDQARASLTARIAQFEQERQQWERQRQQERDLVAAEGFKKTLVLIESMSGDQVKDLLMAMDDAEAARYLSILEDRKAGKIVKAFETAAETARLQRILDRMQNRESLRASSSAAQPSAGAEPAKSRTQ